MDYRGVFEAFTLLLAVIGNSLAAVANRTSEVSTTAGTVHAMTTSTTTTTPVELKTDDDSYHMPGWLIGVICLSILFFAIVVYKFYKYFSTKEVRVPCCPRPQPRPLRRSDTDKPLIRPSVSSGSGSIYKKSQRGAAVA